MFEYKAKVVRVVDGDTLDLSIDLGFQIYHRIRVRLLGVDTPEVYGVKKESAEYEAGLQASTFVKRWVIDHGPWVTVRTFKNAGDKYGRWLATIEASNGSSMLNDELLESGHAKPYDGGAK